MNSQDYSKNIAEQDLNISEENIILADFLYESFSRMCNPDKYSVESFREHLIKKYISFDRVRFIT